MVEWVRRVVTVDTQNWHKSKFAGQSGRPGQTGRINQSDRSGQICQFVNWTYHCIDLVETIEMHI